MTERTWPPADGRRGVGYAYTRVDRSCKASIEAGTVEPVDATHTGDQRIKLGSSPEVEEGARTRVPGDGGAVKPPPEEELPS